jgi:hypothetical protein
MSYVYWIYNDECKDVNTDGYVGITENVDNRFKTHLKYNKRIPKDAKIKVLYEGSREECFNLEYEYRPTKGIGWNSAIGGSHGWQVGFNHSKETCEKMKEAWTNERKQIASKFKAEQNKLLKGQKRPSQSLAMMGNNNPIYGTNRPQHVKDAVSKAHKGKLPYNKMELYCIHCHKRVSTSNLKKYHGIGKKNCYGSDQ